jgi:RNA polymerase-binding transcription factor DksA
MQTETSRGPLTGPEGDGPVPAGGPRWRALLEMRWRARLQEVTELALAYHEEAAAAAGPGAGGSGEGGLQVQRLRHLRQLQRRTVGSRRALADTEEALARLSAGRYGRSESCAAAISAQRLAATPETRYCARCARGWGR